jgi:hypothetical protein
MYGITSEIYVSLLKLDKHIILPSIKFVCCVILLRFMQFSISGFSVDFIMDISKNNSHSISLSRKKGSYNKRRVFESTISWIHLFV